MADDPIKSFMVQLGFVGDPAGAKKVTEQAAKVEADVTKAAEEGAAKREAVEAAAGAKRVGLAGTLGKILRELEETRAQQADKIRRDEAARDERLQAEKEKREKERRARAVKDLQQHATKMASFAIKLVAGVEATALGIVVAVDRAAKSMERLGYASARAGTTPGRMTATAYSFSQLGSTKEAGEGALSALGDMRKNNPAGYAASLDALKVKAREANGALRDPAEALKDIGEALAKIKDGGGTYGYAMAIGRAKNVGLNGDAAQTIMDPRYRRMEDERERIDRSISANQDDAAKSGSAFETSMRRLEATIDSIKTKVTTDLANNIQPVLDALAKWSEAHGKEISDDIVAVADGILKLATAVTDKLSAVNWDAIIKDVEDFGKKLDGKMTDLFGENGSTVLMLAGFAAAITARVLGPLNLVLGALTAIGNVPLVGRLLAGGVNPVTTTATAIVAGGLADAEMARRTGAAMSGGDPNAKFDPETGFVNDLDFGYGDKGAPGASGGGAWSWLKSKLGFGPSDPDARKVKDAILQTAEGVKKLADKTDGMGGDGGVSGGGALGSARRALKWAATAGGNTPRKGIVGNFGEKGWWTPERQSHAIDVLMKQAGVTEDGAKALVARWKFVESAGGPNSVNPHSGAEGIAQWLGGRKGDGSRGTFDEQLAKVARELNGSESRAKQLLNTPGREAAGASTYERAEGYNAATGEDNFTARTREGMRHIQHGVAPSASTSPAAPSSSASAVTEEQYKAAQARLDAFDRTKPKSAAEIHQWGVDSDLVAAYIRARPTPPMNHTGKWAKSTYADGKPIGTSPEISPKARRHPVRDDDEFPTTVTPDAPGGASKPVKVDVTEASARRIGAANDHSARRALSKGSVSVHALAELRKSQEHLRATQTILRNHRGYAIPGISAHSSLSRHIRHSIDASNRSVSITHNPTFTMSGVADPHAVLADAHRLNDRGHATLLRNLNVKQV